MPRTKNKEQRTKHKHRNCLSLSLFYLAEHLFRYSSDHLQPGYVALQFGDARKHTLAELLVDLLKITLLHLVAVFQVGRHRRVFRDILGNHPVDDITADRHVETREHPGSLGSVEEHHLLGNNHEEESGLLFVS